MIRISYRHTFYWVCLFFITIASAGLFSLMVGQDSNWDLLNYHLYNPWAFLSRRTSLDVFPAGIQTYFSPFLDIPYYWMATHTFLNSPRALAFIAGIPFGVLAFLTFVISWIFTKSLNVPIWYRVFLCLFATIFGISGAASVSQVGTTTNELQVASISLSGLLLILLAISVNESRMNNCLSSYLRFFLIFSSGCFFGSAAGLKLTAAVYAPGASLSLFAFNKNLRIRFLYFILFCLGWVASFLLFYYPWGVHLYSLTGDPFFPFFTNIFHSDWLGPTSGRDPRFLPHSTMEALFFPFYWAKRISNIVTEIGFNDPRFSLVYIFFVLSLLIIVASYFILGLRRILSGSLSNYSIQLLSALLVFFGVSYILWELEFSIFRYIVTIESLGGLIIVIGLVLFSAVLDKRLFNSFILFLFFILAYCFIYTTYPDWGRVVYSKSVFVVRTPKIISNATVILAQQPTAYLAKFIADDNSGTRFVGTPDYLFNSSTFDGHLLLKSINTAIEKAHVLYVVYKSDSIPPGALLDHFNKSIDYNSCEIITSNLSHNYYICRVRNIGAVNAKKSMLGEYQITPVTLYDDGRLLTRIELPNTCKANEKMDFSAKINVACKSRCNGDIGVYVQDPPQNPTLFSLAAPPYESETGNWTKAGLNFIFKDSAGRIMKTVALIYRPCRSN